MYKIDSKVDKPDTSYLLNEVKRMMRDGVKLHDLDSMLSKYNSEANTYANYLRDNYGIDNPNSSKQIVGFMIGLSSAEVFDIANVDGKWSSNKDVLTELSDLGYDWADAILKYRKAKKYGDSIKALKDASDSKQMIHPEVSMSKTNRINYSSPALMNIPKSILWSTIAPKNDGDVLISADIKNQEPNILINLTDAEELKPALTSPNGLYEELFNQVYKVTARMNLMITDKDKSRYVTNAEMATHTNIPPVYYTPTRPMIQNCFVNGKRIVAIDIVNFIYNRKTENKLPDTVVVEVDDPDDTGEYLVRCKVNWDIDRPDIQKKIAKGGHVEVDGVIEGIELRCEGQTRKEFKTAWNAMTYGSGIMGIRATCKVIDADTFFKYFNNIKELKDYRKRCSDLASNGIHNIRTYFRTLLDAGYAEPGRLKRILMDLPIQGTAADILALLVKHVNNEIEKRGLTGKLFIYFSRHDELIFEASKDWVNEVGINNVYDTIRDLTEHQVDNWTPFKVEVGIVSGENEDSEDDE